MIDTLIIASFEYSFYAVPYSLPEILKLDKYNNIFKKNMDPLIVH